MNHLRGLLVLFCGLSGYALVAGQADPPANHVGYRKISFVYIGSDGSERIRSVSVWHPTATPARSYSYNGQIGLVAADAGVLAGKHPLIVFSHGFLGAADQTIFLMEALSRKGYIVAAVNHADAITQRRGKPVAWPNFVDAKTWDDGKYRDRKEDLAGLLDYFLTKEGNFLEGHIDETAIGAAGHSLGGYTVLGMAGAWKSWRDERIKAVLLLSPYAMPFLVKGNLDAVTTPAMLQGGSLDLGITPFLPKVYETLHAPKYFLVLKNETHFGWTNLISLGKTTTECVRSGNARLMTNYSIAFFEHHLCGKTADLLRRQDPRLESYQAKYESPLTQQAR